MSENNDKPQDARQLSEEELGSVSGGFWSYEDEQEWQAKWRKLKDEGVSDLPPYEEWLINELNEYDAWAIEDRRCWFCAGCPTDRAYANHGGRR